MNNQQSKINEFFSTIYGLSLFTIKSIYIIVSDSMKKESQTYKEEREQQKREARKVRQQREKS